MTLLKAGVMLLASEGKQTGPSDTDTMHWTDTAHAHERRKPHPVDVLVPVSRQSDL